MTIKAESIIRPLLAWYDRHRRTLPWRAEPGHVAEPYHVWLSEIMLQQTTVQAVGPYFEKFLRHYPDIHTLAAAPQEEIMRDWAGLGYYSRARNLHACAQKVANDMGGTFPHTVAALKTLPGIGEYTAGAIAAIAYGQRASVVDGNVERVIARVFEARDKATIKECAQHIYHDEANDRPADLPQAFMDLGATICTPRKPACAACPLQGECIAFGKGIQDQLPVREKDKPKPARHGYVYWVSDGEGRILMHRRPGKGLLGGMTGLPTSEWNNAPEHLKGFQPGKIEKAKVRHVFTHFALTLSIVHARIRKIPEGYFFAHPAEAGLPTVFGKVVKLMKAV